MGAGSGEGSRRQGLDLENLDKSAQLQSKGGTGAGGGSSSSSSNSKGASAAKKKPVVKPAGGDGWATRAPAAGSRPSTAAPAGVGVRKRPTSATVRQ